MDFTDNAVRFIHQLRGIEDNNSRAQQRIELIAHIKAYVTAWETFFRLYYNIPTHQAFQQLIGNLISENRQIVDNLKKKLSDATIAKRRERTRALFPCLHTTGTLSTFFGYGEVRLRHKQILYATAVVNLITLVVIHVRNQEYVHTTVDHWYAVQRDQLDTIRKMERAMEALHFQERQFRDDLVYPRNWLRGFQYRNDPDRLPLEMVANMWFSTVGQDGHQGPWLDRIFAQMEADRRHSDERYRDLEERWNRQQADWQKLVEELQTQKASLERELARVKQEREMLIVQLRTRPEESHAQILEVDEDIFVIEAKQELVEAERRGMDHDRPVPEHERPTHDVMSANNFHNDQRTLETPKYVTSVPPASESARGRTNLPVRYPQAVSNRYPPQTPVKLTGRRRRGSTPDTRQRSSSRESHSSSAGTDTTLVNSMTASSPQDPRNPQLKPTSRTGSQEAGIKARDPRISDSFGEGHQDSQQQAYEYSRRRKPRGRSSSSSREYEDPYRTLPPQHHGATNSAERKNPYPRADGIGKQFDPQSSSERPRYIPPAAQRSDIQPPRHDSYQGSAPLALGRLART